MYRLSVSLLASAGFRWLVVCFVVGLASGQRLEAEPPQISRLTRGQTELEIIDNSPTLSQALAINASGAIIGVREASNAEQTIFSMQYFYCDDQRCYDLPLLEDYTNVEAMAVSDNGLVVGFASRPIGTAGGSLTAVVWSSATQKLTNLGRPEGYRGSLAQDICADGSKISGYVLAAEPPRLQPCVWSWHEARQAWDAQILETKIDYNPYLMSSRAILSPDGRRVAACCTFEIINEQIVSALYVWEQVDGKWERKQIHDEQFYLKDMNNAGIIVGSLAGKDGERVPCFADLQGKLTTIELLAGDVSGEAWGINSRGTIVGLSDDPRGAVGGPQAFVWQDGKTRPLDLGDAPYSAAYGINEGGQIAGLLDTVIGPDSDSPIEKTLAFRTLVPKPSPAAKSSQR